MEGSLPLGPMVQEEVALRERRFEEFVRVLAASANTRILHWLVEARRKEPDAGWRFLSEIAGGKIGRAHV